MDQMGVCNEEKWIQHYSNSHKILLVGEGNFSFAVCLAKTFGTAENVIATSFDSKGFLTNAYTNANTNLKELKKRRCTVLHHMDAHTMHRHPHLRSKLFDRIVFNFPHAGFIWPECWKPQIELHRKLVRGFLSNANHMLTENGEVHITHKTTHPFSKWEIVELAEEIGLCLVEKVPFVRWYYPGYVHKRGSGARINQTFHLGECSTFKFTSKILFHNTLIDGMCNAGKLTIAREMFSSLPTKGLQPNDRTYNIMINGFCKEGLLKEARELFEKMNKNGCSPDHFTYNIIIQGFLQHNETSWAVKYFQMMVDKGFSANVTTNTIWTNLFSTKKVEQTVKVWQIKQDKYAEMQRRKDEEREAKERMLAEQATRDWQSKQDKYAEIQRRKDEEHEAKERMLTEQAARDWQSKQDKYAEMQRRKDEEREANESMLAEQAARDWQSNQDKYAEMQRRKDEERETNERMLTEQAARDWQSKHVQDKYAEMRRRKDEEHEAKEHILKEEALKARRAREEEATTLEFEKRKGDFVENIKPQGPIHLPQDEDELRPLNRRSKQAMSCVSFLCCYFFFERCWGY
ncbi:pentatricopeptide repeat-containing protein At1g64100-like [Corylus avellana]|uniref:pentatricopeptide repeat-containing protein At1g64100-like n=1 Tax=Corylus avellana TaxID=13451 RepID=UPI00286C2400|nr:pentatricopeptide repeat-containing protein At1g64100-like [Corylus avellana]